MNGIITNRLVECQQEDLLSLVTNSFVCSAPMESLAERLKTQRKLVRLSQTEVARRVASARSRPFSQQAYAALESGAAKTSVELPAIAEVLGCSLEWLRDGVATQQNPVIDRGNASCSVTVKGNVQAGFFTDDAEWPQDDWYQVQIAPVDEYPGITLHACEVLGPSMNKIYPEGTVLIWVNIMETMERPISGKRYIVRRTRPGGEYELTVKTYFEDPASKWLVAESDRPEFQGPIKMENGLGDQVQIIGRVIRSIREE